MGAQNGRKRKTGGMAGVVVGKTAICSISKEKEGGMGLTYRGYPILELAAHSNFEEVAYLLLYGELPDADELLQYRRRLAELRRLPEPIKSLLEDLPAAARPMDVLRTGCSALGCFEPEGTFDNQHHVADRLLAVFPSMLLYWYKYHHQQQRIETQTGQLSLAGHFLELLHGKPPAELPRRALDVSLILYAEHELAASTFAARIAASTWSDLYSAVTAAIGTLRGPLHGGANEAALALLLRFRDPDDAERGVLERLARKERVMGFGHPVYTTGDPRSNVIKAQAKALVEESGDRQVYRIAERVETVMAREKQLFPNLDFYAAVVYHALQIPSILFTPLFVCTRSAGWAAHVIEQRGAGKILRPTAEYAGAATRPYVPIAERQGRAAASVAG